MSFSTFYSDLQSSADLAAQECLGISKSVLSATIDDHYECEGEGTFAAILYDDLRKQLSAKNVLALVPDLGKANQYGRADLVYCPSGLTYNNNSDRDGRPKVLVEIKALGHMNSIEVMEGVRQANELQVFEPQFAPSVVLIVAFIGNSFLQTSASQYR